jgi:hypothetical protein
MSWLEKATFIVLVPLIAVGIFILGKDGAVQAVEGWIENRDAKKQDKNASEISTNEEQQQEQQAAIAQLQEEEKDAESDADDTDPADFYNDRK